jgi:hypothetical protein
MASWANNAMPRAEYLNDGTYNTVLLRPGTAPSTHAPGKLYYDSAKNHVFISKSNEWIPI